MILVMQLPNSAINCNIFAILDLLHTIKNWSNEMKRNKWLGRTFYILLFLTILACGRLAWLNYFYPETQPKATNGELNILSNLIDQDALIYLQGEWLVYQDVKKDQMHHLSKQNSRLITTNENTMLTGTSAVAEIILHTKKSFDSKQLTLRIPKSPYSTTTYVNGKEIAKSTNKNKGQYDDYLVSFTPKSSDIKIDLLVQGTENLQFPFFSKSIVLGTSDAIHSAINFNKLLILIIIVTLVLNSLYSLIVYFFVFRHKSVFLCALAFLFPILDELYRVDQRINTWLNISPTTELRISSMFFILPALFFAIVIHSIIADQEVKYYRFIIKCYILGILSIIFVPTQYFSLLNLFLYSLYIGSFIYLFLFIRKTTRLTETEIIFLLFTVCAATSGIIWDYIKSKLYFDIPFYPVDYICIELGFAGFWIYRYYLNQKKVDSLVSQLKRSNEMKEEFLESSSQKLFAPLSKVMILAEHIKDNPANKLTQTSIKQLDDLLKVGQGMYFSLNEVIDYTRIKENVLTHELNPVNLNGVLHHVTNLLQYITDYSQTNIQVHIKRDFPYVLADENRMIQMLFNLLYYAIKNTENETIKISTTNSHNRAVLKIIGVSINDDKNEALINNNGESMNLSLFVCQKLAELQGGNLQIDENEDKKVDLVLSLQLADEANIIPTEINLEPTYGEMKHEASINILVITESLEEIQLIRAVFSTDEYALHFARSSDHVMDYLKEREWNLIIIDSILSSQSGYSFIKQIRDKFSTVELPILYITTRQDSLEANSCFKAGANDYMIKPLQPIELKNRCQALIEMQLNVEEKLSLESALLQAQIQPHFLFNTLNSIASLSRTDTEKMIDLLITFGDYLNASFNPRNTQRLIPLDEELKLVQSYTYIEEQRFAPRLKVDWDIDSDVNAMIPPFSLQTLVENSIRHGIQKKIEGGTVKIMIKNEENDVLISVIDDGVGIQHEKLATIFEETHNRGIGIINTNKRLKQSYGEELHIQSEYGKGTSVSMKIPKKIPLLSTQS